MKMTHIPVSPEDRLKYLAHECAETVQKICYAQALGLDDDTLDKESTPRAALLEQLEDLLRAAHAVQKDLRGLS